MLGACATSTDADADRVGRNVYNVFLPVYESFRA